MPSLGAKRVASACQADFGRRRIEGIVRQSQVVVGGKSTISDGVSLSVAEGAAVACNLVSVLLSARPSRAASHACFPTADPRHEPQFLDSIL
jgi:hypothetical protein